MGRKGQQRYIYLGDSLDEAVHVRLKETGESLSDFLRAAAAERLGRSDLAVQPKMGRPRKPDEPAAPRKKAVQQSTGKVVSAAKKATKKRAAE